MQKTQESNEAQLKNLENECSRYKAQVDFYEKYLMMKPFLDDACKFSKLVLEPGESSGHARDVAEKQTDLVNCACWELLKTYGTSFSTVIIALLPSNSSCSLPLASTCS